MVVAAVAAAGCLSLSSAAMAAGQAAATMATGFHMTGEGCLSQ